jgi:cell wall assembly regulator SMI1
MALNINNPYSDPDMLWRAYLGWLAEHAPQVAAKLNPPADPAAIAELEALIGHRLPEAVIAGWRLHDGQRCEDDHGVALGFWWLPVAAVAREWTGWREVGGGWDEQLFEDDLDRAQRSFPKGTIQCRYTTPGWIPLLQWPFDGDSIGLDFNPGPAGTPGQVINFGRDQENKTVIADDFATLMAWMLQEANAGRVAGPKETADCADDCDCDCHDDCDCDDDCDCNDARYLRHIDGTLDRAARIASGGPSSTAGDDG